MRLGLANPNPNPNPSPCPNPNPTPNLNPSPNPNPRQDDALCKAFCTPSGSLSKAMFPPFSPSKLLLENACYFPGITRTA